MKNFILLLAICLTATCLNSAAESDRSINKISLEEKLLTVIPKEYSEPGWYEFPGYYSNGYFVFKVQFERYGGGWEVTLSPDYSKVAYRAKAGGKMFVVINGEKQSDFDDVRYLTFNRDGSKLAYAAKLKDRWFIVSGDEKGPEFDKVGPPVFSPDEGNRLAYAAELKKKEFLVVDGHKGEEFDDISSPIFSPNGKTLACVARPIESKKSVLFIGDKKVAEHPMISDVTFSPNGKIAYAAGKPGHFSIYFGDKQSPEFDLTFAPTFSPDENQIAFLAIKPSLFNTKPFVVSGDYRGPEYSVVSPPVFSADGNKLVYVGKKAIWLHSPQSLLHFGDTVAESKCMVSNYLSPISLTGVESWTRTFTVSPDGGKIACMVIPDADRKVLPRFNKRQIAVGNQFGPKFDDVGLPVFSSDGSAVGYWARMDREIWWKVMTVN